MSTFTQWNSPNAGAAANIPVQKFTELITAYSEVVNKIDRHIKSVTNEDDHHVIDYVKGELETLEHLLDSKFATPANIAEAINNLYKANGEMKRQVEQWAANALSEPLAARVDHQTLEQSLANYQTKTAAGLMQNTVDSLVEITEALEEFMNLYKKKFSVDDSDSKNIIHKFEDTLEAEKLLVDTLRVHKYLDFTKWDTVALQYAGTGARDTVTAGMYIVGRVSDDWKDDPQEISDAKSCRVYLKYVNSHPFDAIVDITVTKTADGYNGNIQAMVSKGDDFWENLRFHLVEVTDTQHGTGVYLGISTSSLANTVSNFNSLTIRVAGVNFIPLNRTNRVETIITSICFTTKMPVEKNAAILTTTIAMDALAIDNIVDSDGRSIIKVTDVTDEDDATKTYKLLQIGNEEFKVMQLLNRPIMYEKLTDEDGNILVDEKGNPKIEKHCFITDNDANRLFSLPVGSIVQWSDFEEVTNGNDEEGNPIVVMRRAINVPKGWHACDGSDIKTEGHEELAALRIYPFTDEGETQFTLPVVDFSIIKTTFGKFGTIYPEYSELIDLQNVINRVNRLADKLTTEEERSKTRDQVHDDQLAGTVDSGLKTLIEAEAATARANEGTLQTNINNERTRAKGEESNLQSAIETEARTARANENTLQTNITTEEGRAKGEEGKLQSAIEAEARTRGEEDEDIRAALQTETDNRESEDGLLSTLITNEHDRAEEEEGRLQGAINTEKGRAETEETAIRAELSTERNRAVGAEGNLQSGLNAANTRIDETNAALEAEKTTARTNEQSLQKHIDDEAAMARASESALHDEVSEEYSRARKAENDLGTSITNVRGALNEEIANARQAESDITASLTAETDRATTEERRLNSQMSLKESALNTAIADESSRAQVSEGNLRTKIENTKAELQSNIDTANSTRNEADVNLLKYIQETYLENKQVYRDRIELPNVTPDAKGNVWHTGDIAVLFDGTNIKTVTATVNGEIVTWSE